MRSRTSLIIVVSFIVMLSAFGQQAGLRKMVKELKLTDQQQEQFDKVTFDTQKKLIELKAKVATSKLELRRLMDAESLDKSSIEKKMNEIAVTEVAIRMNHLTGWSEKNKVLTPEQQKIWKKALAQRPEQMKQKMMMQREMHENMGAPMDQEREITIERRMKK